MKNIKNLSVCAVSALMASLAFTSCDNEEVMSVENENMHEKVTMSSPPKEGSIGLIIVKFDIGRESKDCEKLGFCNVTWFPGFDNDQPIKDFMPTIPPPRYIASNSTVEARFSDDNVKPNNELTFDIYFDRAVTSLDVEPFIIDQDLEIVGLDKTVYTIKAGIFEYDKNIGPYGGYSIGK